MATPIEIIENKVNAEGRNLDLKYFKLGKYAFIIFLWFCSVISL